MGLFSKFNLLSDMNYDVLGFWEKLSKKDDNKYTFMLSVLLHRKLGLFFSHFNKIWNGSCSSGFIRNWTGRFNFFYLFLNNNFIFKRGYQYMVFGYELSTCGVCGIFFRGHTGSYCGRCGACSGCCSKGHFQEQREGLGLCFWGCSCQVSACYCC